MGLKLLELLVVMLGHARSFDFAIVRFANYCFAQDDKQELSCMFSDFHGNAETVHRLRDMLARERFPHAVVLAGGQGTGKYTLALMLAQALNCLSPTAASANKTDGLPDFCGKCANCVRIAQAADLDARFAEAVEARENLRETDKKETRLFRADASRCADYSARSSADDD